ncbi:7-deoxyloganetin glucosyltransferase protein [Dioscorea alata]|uniref:7-deoxyloganetin glucosyltransferase protein n=1 Tax=Dioscorea alata TaxID=55571 RepID=A0ACB7W804_DIOAL|nr:7-deoxyloganetin glucosyltransferase protein [Dioscorea alata]
MGSLSNEKKPHAVCIPYPAQGHVTPMLKLAKLLHSNGFHITFVNTHFNHKRLLKSRGVSSLSGVPGFDFKSIPDGLPPSNEDATQDVPALCESATNNFLAPFLDLLRNLNHDPPVSCIVSDGVMSFTLDAAKQLGVPEVLFWTTSACGFMGYLHYQHLIDQGLVPLKSEEDLTNGYLDMHITTVPGMDNMRLKDFPSFVRTTNPNDTMLNYCRREARRASMGSAIILNTFEDLEGQVLDAMRSILKPPIFTIGSLSLLNNNMIKDAELYSSLGSNLWKEEFGCFEWLKGRREASVVYVNFGSVTVMSNEHLVEFAWGLANSKQDFLWVIRGDLVKGDSAVLPQEFLEEINGRGMMATWCPQEEVLNNPAIGGFLTHSGWNSTIESIVAGVPMISWPFFAEQQTNCRYVCVEWGLGMEIDSDVKRDEVEKQVRELMEGEKGEEMRKKAMELKEKAFRSTEPNGTSTVNFEKLVHEVLLSTESKLSNDDAF